MHPNLPRPAPEPEKRSRLAESELPQDQLFRPEAVRSGGAYTPKPSFDSEATEKRRSRWWIAIVAATLISTGAIVIAISGKPAPPAVQEQKVLVLSEADLDDEATASTKAALARGEIPPLLAPMPEPLRQEIAAGAKSLYTVRILDSQEDDGDAVKISVNDAPIGEVILSNAGTKLMIPLQKGAMTMINCLASRDGGGGVTFGAISSNGEVRTRVLAVGEAERWSVVFK